MKFSHAVVWLDHQRAQVIHFNADSSQTKEIKHKGGANHLHHKHGAVGSGHAAEDPAYYHAVAEALKGTAEVLVLGPAAAKTEFIKHIKGHDKAVASAVVGVENADHPSEGQILAHARQWFEKFDRTVARNDMPLKVMKPPRSVKKKRPNPWVRPKKLSPKRRRKKAKAPSYKQNACQPTVLNRYAAASLADNLIPPIQNRAFLRRRSIARRNLVQLAIPLHQFGDNTAYRYLAVCRA